MSESPVSPPMEPGMEKFLEEQTVLSMATSVNDKPYCASCYYAFVPGDNLLVFKSDEDTQHIEDALRNNQVAGTVLPDKLEKTKIRGIQFSGVFRKPEGSEKAKAERKYLSKYPVATLFRGTIWVIELSRIKFTDNALLKGRKILWER
ncbi:MAG TPA: pyridoxamine 5'-phosphate oxidase family protein [Lacibacter sp.]|nr:pyridoxamine 5'-phosphate oxidase family protein [Lacibacter sp.]HMO89726.1 pyridoxamine 5'-phosphate oxidase family protein [Lacibacter sp.]HMP87360.1 pyridoxamine 5'-phosphate oxidase family protein [Lacibacter sp.]